MTETETPRPTAPLQPPERALLPAAVRARVAHTRTRPFRYAFDHGTTMWLVDLADVDATFPRWLRPLARLRTEDHLAPGTAPLAAKVRTVLDAEGLAWRADRVLMLTGVRSLGHAFDPLTTYFCFGADGTLEGVLAEVHNTYGERHCYPLAVRPAGVGARAEVDKGFYVSPFFTVAGRYDIECRLSPAEVGVRITLSQDETVVFSGSVRGRLRPATRSVAVLREVARNPAPALRVAALIRWHGIRLWLKRLPVVPRRPHQPPKGMA